MTGSDIHLERLVDAPPDVAFELWNDPGSRVSWHKLAEHWIVEASTELCVGGRWRVMFGPSLDELTVEDGVYEIVEPPHRVSYTCTHRLPGRRPFETRIAVTFEARANQTLVTSSRLASLTSRCAATSTTDGQRSSTRTCERPQDRTEITRRPTDATSSRDAYRARS